MSQSTGCSQPELLERLYQHFAQPSAWDVYPGAQDALKKIRATGMPRCECLTVITQLCCSSSRAGSLSLRAAVQSELAAEGRQCLLAYVACMTRLGDQNSCLPST